MKFKFVWLLVTVLLINSLAYAQSNATSEQTTANNKIEKNYTAQDYETLVAKLKSGDTNIDFTALRMAFTKTKNYSYHGSDKEEREKFLTPFGNKNYKEALKQSEKYLENNYVDPNAHFVAYNSAKELKDDKKAEFYKTVLLGLLNSIKNGNDGFSAETPFKVITIDEEYTFMSFLGYKHGSQSLQSAGGHQFDVFTATDTKTNKEVKLYFNIDVVWKAESEIFGK